MEVRELATLALGSGQQKNECTEEGRKIEIELEKDEFELITLKENV